jgi:hypothetical protein
MKSVVYFKCESYIEGEAIGPVWIGTGKKVDEQLSWMTKSAARELAKERGLEFFDEDAEREKIPEVKTVLDRFDALVAEWNEKQARIEAEYGPPRNCPDCGAKVGERHQVNCDVERCTACKGQRLGCSCAGHDPEKARWDGRWPGEVECLDRGWMLGKGIPDPNRLTVFEMTGEDPGENGGYGRP